MTLLERIKEAEEKIRRHEEEYVKKTKLIEKVEESMAWFGAIGIKELVAHPKVGKEAVHTMRAPHLRSDYFVFLFRLFEKKPVQFLSQILEKTREHFSYFNREDVVMALKDLEEIYGDYSPLLKLRFPLIENAYEKLFGESIVPFPWDMYKINHDSPFWFIYMADEDYFLNMVGSSYTGLMKK